MVMGTLMDLTGHLTLVEEILGILSIIMMERHNVTIQTGILILTPDQLLKI